MTSVDDEQETTPQEAWRRFNAQPSLSDVFAIGAELQRIRKRVLDELGLKGPGKGRYPSAFSAAVEGAGFHGMNQRTARDFIRCSERRSEVEGYVSERVSNIRSVHPNSLICGVERQKKSGPSKRKLRKNLPSKLVADALAEMSELERLNHIVQLVDLLKKLALDYLPDSSQHADAAIVSLMALEDEARCEDGFIVRNVKYRDLESAARHLGITVKQMRAHLRASTVDRAGIGHKKGGLYVRGVYYESHADCADALGCTVEGVRSAIKRGDLERLGLNGGRSIMIRGVEYDSQRSAAEVLGVSEQTISEARRRGTLERVGQVKGRKVIAGRSVELVQIFARDAGDGGRLTSVTLPSMADIGV